MPSVAALAPTGLPVEEVVGSVRTALSERGVAVLQAAPGAGKTTVIPLRLREEPWVGDGRILVLEPRRVAARAAAARMAALLGEEVGGSVGYRTRDDRRVSARTRIEVVTEGILTRRVQADPSLAGVSLVVFDEFHERRLQTDLGLALTLDARSGLRPDLRILVMSATLAADAVAALLGDADDGGPVPVVTSEGRSHPVQVRWGSGGGVDLRAVVPGVVGLARRALEEQEGDLLVFLPGVAEIDRVARGLRDAGIGRGSAGGGGAGDAVEIRPLHGSLPAAVQDAALGPTAPGHRKAVLATDLAETSLTVEGVRVVVDAGLARGPRFDPGSGLTRLHTGRASRASAEQRAGRAGRTAPGVVYRWWSEADHATRQAFGQPEILTVDLAALALELAVWGARANELAWLDEPPAPALAEARRLLADLGALESAAPAGRPTPAGRAMAGLPLHPRLARMVLDAAPDRRDLAYTLAALVEERDVFRREGRDAIGADAAERIAVLRGGRGGGDAVDARAVEVVRRRARDLAARGAAGGGRAGAGGRAGVGAGAGAGAGAGSRAGLGWSPGVESEGQVGPLLALAYPDRLAQARGGGRFRLREGPGVVVAPADPLSGEAYLVVVDVTPANPGASWARDGRVRLAAAIDESDVEVIGGPEIRAEEAYIWVDGEVRHRVRRVLGELVLFEQVGPARPGPGLAEALADRVAADGVEPLGWDDAARSLQQRVRFARTLPGGTWPDVSDAGLAATTAEWLPPRLARARGRGDLAAVRMSGVIRAMLGPAGVGRLDEVAPTSIQLANGRRASVSYGEGRPTIRVRAQDLFGIRAHPTVGGGRVPVVVEVLSPAGRPIQVTGDLPGFWAGSWQEVRRELAGRYPKHNWPADPAAASVTGRGGDPRERAPQPRRR